MNFLIHKLKYYYFLTLKNTWVFHALTAIVVFVSCQLVSLSNLVTIVLADEGTEEEEFTDTRPLLQRLQPLFIVIGFMIVWWGVIILIEGYPDYLAQSAQSAEWALDDKSSAEWFSPAASSTTVARELPTPPTSIASTSSGFAFRFEKSTPIPTPATSAPINIPPQSEPFTFHGTAAELLKEMGSSSISQIGEKIGTLLENKSDLNLGLTIRIDRFIRKYVICFISYDGSDESKTEILDTIIMGMKEKNVTEALIVKTIDYISQNFDRLVAEGRQDS